jgi:hypothetical protein
VQRCHELPAIHEDNGGFFARLVTGDKVEVSLPHPRKDTLKTNTATDNTITTFLIDFIEIFYFHCHFLLLCY